MQDRILEIVVYLMNQLSEQKGSLANIEEMSADLQSMGFTENEISSAYNWIIGHFEDYPESFAFEDLSKNETANRVLSTAERKVVSSEAYGYLLQLRYLGLLSVEQMEMILDRAALFAAEPMDVSEVKILASAAMFDGNGFDLPLSIWAGDSENEPIN